MSYPGINSLLNDLQRGPGEGPPIPIGRFDIGYISQINKIDESDPNSSHNGTFDVVLTSRRLYLTGVYMISSMWTFHGGTNVSMPEIGAHCVIGYIGYQNIPFIVGFLPVDYVSSIYQSELTEIKSGEVILQSTKNPIGSNAQEPSGPGGMIRLDNEGRIIIRSRRSTDNVVMIIEEGDDSNFNIVTKNATINIDADGTTHIGGRILDEIKSVVTKWFLENKYINHKHIGNMGGLTTAPVGQNTIELLGDSYATKVRAE